MRRRKRLAGGGTLLGVCLVFGLTGLIIPQGIVLAAFVRYFPSITTLLLLSAGLQGLSHYMTLHTESEEDTHS